jgi:hypothetical protein
MGRGKKCAAKTKAFKSFPRNLLRAVFHYAYYAFYARDELAAIALGVTEMRPARRASALFCRDHFYTGVY